MQGPLPGTLSEFWRLVWEQRVGVVVMITNTVEQGKRKCEQYWPELGAGAAVFGLLEVSLVQESVQAHCTVRTLRLRHTRLNKRERGPGAVREVTQHQYTSWPDHGTPTNIAPVLSFIKKSSAACQVRADSRHLSPHLASQETEGPLLVHCSAGVGRTGTYIVIDSMLKQLRAKGEINIASFLSHIRHQRAFLVQTEDQFRLIHDTLGECGYIVCQLVTLLTISRGHSERGDQYKDLLLDALHQQSPE